MRSITSARQSDSADKDTATPTSALILERVAQREKYMQPTCVKSIYIRSQVYSKIQPNRTKWRLVTETGTGGVRQVAQVHSPEVRINVSGIVKNGPSETR